MLVEKLNKLRFIVGRAYGTTDEAEE